MKSNSFSKWKAGTWASGTEDEIGLAVVDLRELSGVAESFAGTEVDPVLLFSDGGFGKAGKPTVCGGEEVALHIRLRESPTLDDGFC